MDLGYVKACLKEIEDRGQLTQKVIESHNLKRSELKEESRTEKYVREFNEIQDFVDIQMGSWVIIGQIGEFLSKNPTRLPLSFTIEDHKKQIERSRLTREFNVVSEKIHKKLLDLATAQDQITLRYERGE